MTSQSKLKLDYSSVQNLVKPLLSSTRTESAAFLLWFLQNIYRLEDFAAEDAVCDGMRDKGIDGIYVDENNERIEVLQARLGKKQGKTIGDASLREFAGTLSHFNDVDSVQRLAQQTINDDLRALLEKTKIGDLIEKGYELRGVFVTNMTPDDNTREYLQNEKRVRVYDRDEIISAYIPPGAPAVMRGSKRLTVDSSKVSRYNLSSATVYFAPLSATELIDLAGIESGALFAWNVRQSLGRTKVNKEIAQSIVNVTTHENFLLFHNGLTILARTVKLLKNAIKIDEYTVVNGCQSLSSMYDQREHLTDKLKVLARIIKIDPGADLASEITHHSNNQNPISARDLQSNSSIQRRLQEEFKSIFRGDVFYRIKRGETSTAPLVIDNELAARIMLAFDLREPWSCHQTYKLFDEKYADIFGRKEVTAPRILGLYALYEAANKRLEQIDYMSMSRYRLTTFFLLFVLRRVLEDTEDIGKKFCQAPDNFVNNEPNITKIQQVAGSVLDDVLFDINAEIRERAEEESFFDYKRLLKSPKAVADLSRSIVPQYQKGVKRKRAVSFGEAWQHWKDSENIGSG